MDPTPEITQVAGPEQTYKFNVVMNCSGCSGAVDRVLKKVEGVSYYDISLAKQEVVVKGTVPYDTVYEKIKKTGKEVKSGEVVSQTEEKTEEILEEEPEEKPEEQTKEEV